jgi:hydroxymethylbilane synthase
MFHDLKIFDNSLIQFRNTRISKLDAANSPFAALVLAKAGMVRVGMGDRLTSDIRAPTLYYAVSQGALAIEVRSDDAEAIELCKKLTHRETSWMCLAERACLRVLEGGCSVPVGVASVLKSEKDSEVLKVTGCVTGVDGKDHVEHTLEEVVRSPEDAEQVGEKLAKILLDSGARKILDDINADRDRRVGEAEAADEVKASK